MRDTVDRPRRAFWLKHLHRWHWISSAVSLVVLFMFSVTGFTLNHAAQIEAAPQVERHAATLPGAMLKRLVDPGRKSAPVDAVVARYVREQTGADIAGRDGDWSDDEVYLSLPRPGGDAWVSIDRETGEVQYESTDRGWLAWFNDLHKGRNTGPAWRWFIDVFALACVVFAATGLLLLKMHASQRGMTWPLVALGFVLPLVLALLFIH
ncbi:PepSY-associated TM helix domain-containing protein [Luteibacter aegosomatissinici]|uniref:PepSY-associated TM helix domain-containing protein n=1 Tax=Luteibacter aegosomatissinici TaxID=2911539 RepID=UPI001FF898F0|nr:PepSY-associated TM helix domain-containing protein [Luteibacter aegosomatissinici]UPG93563.1 PepSY-associated TM helix domain-containing protein [Luteibacter aegosomatissinici]